MPSTSTLSKWSGSPVTLCPARGGIGLLAVCREIPRACATPETDMDSSVMARSPRSPAESVSRACGWARSHVSGLRARRQCVHAKCRWCTSNCVGLYPAGMWVSHRATGPRACPWGPQDLQNESSNPIACSTPQWLSSTCGAGPPRSVPGHPGPGRSSGQNRRR